MSHTYSFLSISEEKSAYPSLTLSRYVKSLLPSPLSVPSPFDGRNERREPRKFCTLKWALCQTIPDESLQRLPSTGYCNLKQYFTQQALGGI